MKFRKKSLLSGRCLLFSSRSAMAQPGAVDRTAGVKLVLLRFWERLIWELWPEIVLDASCYRPPFPATKINHGMTGNSNLFSSCWKMFGRLMKIPNRPLGALEGETMKKRKLGIATWKCRRSVSAAWG